MTFCFCGTILSIMSFNVAFLKCLNLIKTFFNLSVANGIYQNTVYGLAAKLPFKFTGAVVLGSVSKH